MSRCAQCGAEFLCGVVDAGKSGMPEQCWCMALPRMPSSGAIVRDRDGPATTCLCPDCLRTLRSQHVSIST